MSQFYLLGHLQPELVVNYLQKLKSSEESLKEQLEKAKKREAAFIVTFAKREQEIADLKTRKLLLDPAIHEEFTRLKVNVRFPCSDADGCNALSLPPDKVLWNMVEEKEKKVKELQDNIAAINFTPQSKNGKMLMAKCRTLQEENEEIGAMASEGKIHELAMKLALQKSQNAELRDQFEALYKNMEGLTNDVERSNEMVFLLQDKVEEKDYEIRKLKDLLSQRESQGRGGDIDEDKKKVTDEANSAEAEN
ncbi:hypothetical protein Taro_007101 [Colocasia esculenta]|uniref:FKBP12-interacting protein of 37 kDa n=1 Tax=Colocasia esculenta TaxID=4460 RepID=A0A843U2Y5_COLES|nr:hypothetical protein [Colocasia esculenta]